MTDKRVWKGMDQFSVRNKTAGLKDNKDETITKEDVDAALERFCMAIKNEEISETWLPPLTESSNSRTLDDGHAVTQSTTARTEWEEHSLSPDVGDAHVNRHGRSGTARFKYWGRVASTAAAAVLLVGLFSTPLGSKAIAGALQTMYFHNVVGVGHDDLTQIERAFSASSDGKTNRIDLKQYGSVVVSGNGSMQSNLTLDAAAERADLPVKLLKGYNPKRDSVYYTPEREVTFRLHVNAINSLIQRLGGTSELPTSVDGEAIVVRVPAQLTEQINGDAGKYVSLTEFQIPVVQVPSDVNMHEVRDVLLSLPFLPSDIRQSLSESENWTDTMYVPVGGKVTNLTVDGFPAVLQKGDQGTDPSILWLKHGVVFHLVGSQTCFPSSQALVGAAKELAE